MTVYKLFPKRELLKDWEKLLKCTRKEVEELLNEWKEIDKENLEKYKELNKEKSEKLLEMQEFMVSKGIEIFKYKKKGFFTEKNGFLPWYKKNVVDEITKKYPYYSSGVPYIHMESKEVNGVDLYNNQSPTDILQLFDRITHQYKIGISKLNKSNKLLIKSIEYASKFEIDIDELNTKEIIEVVGEEAKRRYLEEELPEGSEVHLKHACYECNSYIVGERRCSCGNRRIDIQVEGDLLEGFYHYPEPY
jgi:hypothetical protein